MTNLKHCSNLQTLLMVGNPWAEEKGEDFKMEALIALIDLPLTRVNDLEEEAGLVSEEDRVEART